MSRGADKTAAIGRAAVSITQNYREVSSQRISSLSQLLWLRQSIKQRLCPHRGAGARSFASPPGTCPKGHFQREYLFGRTGSRSGGALPYVMPG